MVIQKPQRTVQLKNYVLLSPEAINLDDAKPHQLQQIANAEPLAWIEYWAVNPDYDGKVFRSAWQDYRGNTANDADALRVVTTGRPVTAPAQGRAKVCAGGGCGLALRPRCDDGEVPHEHQDRRSLGTGPQA